ncbi:M23 family metallopeptidase [Priestia taiwanensis]|uniref:Stage II sporulation protein Q n=1 Tax=Priestia taiwanensis TaxID=1347902 RepID=A0A917EUE1_9BACI|nr:M23 family metallopeptidase [Priestia taiwanensis]MBM7364349.1 stage II sporulation protein Q [Priestia taiwanensis]GGE85194.1 stage II sporulation protein Q [Priestia taiwanensis]
MREEENKKPSRNKKVVKLLRKRWIFPALYLSSAAVIITGALLFQYATGDKTKQAEDPQTAQVEKENPATPVTKGAETVKMPVAAEDAVSIAKRFYRENASAAEQQAALVQYGNDFTANTGIDLVAKDKKVFDVVAALSGTVERADADPLLGNVVVVKHENGLTTSYQGLGNVEVAVGDKVKQGQVLGKAGQSTINKDLGLHVHFEIRQGGVALNPEDYFNKTTADIKVDAGKKEEVKDSKKPAEESKTPAADREKQDESKKPADEKKDPQN